jgi:hypothetical protein
LLVIPAYAGIQLVGLVSRIAKNWTPACAGVTSKSESNVKKPDPGFRRDDEL